MNEQRFHCAWPGYGTMALLVVLAGCTSHKARPSCPTGYFWGGDACIKQQDIHFGQDRLFVDDGAVPEGGETQAHEGVSDVRPHDANAPATIGAPCKSSNDCQGISTQTGCVPDTEKPDAGCLQYNTDVECLNNDVWKNGYCGLSDCLSFPCPTGSLCVGVSPNRAWCVAPCEKDSDCRTSEGYACKAVLDAEGDLVHACLPAGKGATGSPCKLYTDCQGDMDCLTSFKDGYCAQRDCSKDVPCPEGSACVQLHEGAACLKSCATDGDCKTDQVQDRSCKKLHSAVSDGDKVKVCVAGTGGKKIGDPCTQDYECDSDKCQVVFRGQCKGTTRPCNATDDCDGRVCDTTDPATILGYCTKDCKLLPKSCGSTSHSGPAVCLQTNDGFRCMPACISQACTIKYAMICAYGFDKSGFGVNKYCMPAPKQGDWGTFCTQDSDCHNKSQSPECLKGSGGYGYCTGVPRLSNGQRTCPFPMQYAMYNGRHLCLRYCRPGQGDCTDLPGKDAEGGEKTDLQCTTLAEGNFCVPRESNK